MGADPLHLLCIEPRFPGRLGAVADWLVRRRGYRCRFFFHTADPPEFWPPSAGRGSELVAFNVGGVAREPSVAWTRGLERALCYAYGCWEVLDARRPRPVDLILGRSAGLGSALFAPVSFPAVPVVQYFDYFHHAHAHDLCADLRPDMPVEYFHWRRSANAMDLLDLENGVHPWTATEWQRSLYPAEYRADFTVRYDGIDARRFAPQAPRDNGRRRVIAGRTVDADTRVVSFVARHLDRLRGFERFVELANRLLQARRDVVCVAVGDPTVQRGLDVDFYNRDYRAHVLQQNPLVDPERVWFTGEAGPAVVAELLAASDLHIYASRPYPVSRSLVEAMAAGCVVLAGDTAPAREFIEPDHTGLVAPPDDPDTWERLARAVLDAPAQYRPLGQAAARTTLERFSHDATLPGLAEWFHRLVGGD
jgi:hypothetical protein